MSDRLFSDCCYGTSLQHGGNDPCPRLVCIGCGELADADAETGCDCVSGLLYSAAQLGTTWYKPSAIRAEIARLEGDIEELHEQIAVVRNRAREGQS